ncbi:hypothetical protein [Kyrpidia tusciae]|uniref:hypothetical protein n=1 Tax=Kyrpidia tusciae TaxID=33943 RepID=UPI00389926F1
MESKSVPHHVYIDKAGNWYREGHGNGNKSRRGMSNTIEQNNRYIAVLKDLFDSIQSLSSPSMCPRSPTSSPFPTPRWSSRRFIYCIVRTKTG